MRDALRLCRDLVYLAMTLVLIGVALLYSPGVLRSVVTVLQPLVPGLSVGAVSGTLADGLSLHRLGYVDDEIELHIHSAQLHWQPAALLHGHLDIIALRVHGLSVTYKGSATDDSYHWQVPLPVNLDALSISDIRLVLGKRIPAIRLASLQARGQARADTVHVQQLQVRGKPLSAEALGHAGLDVDALANPKLAQQVMTLDARGAWLGDHLQIDALQASAGTSQLSVSGRVGERLDLHWQIDSTDLGQLLTGAAGQLHSRGSASGRLSRPRLQGELTARDLAFGDYRLRRARAQARLDVNAEQRSRLQVTLDQLDTPQAHVRALQLDTEGVGALQHSHLQLGSALGDADIRLSGPWPRPGRPWPVQLQSVRLAPADLPAWQLDAPTGLVLAPDNVLLQHGCWHSGPTRLCAGAHWQAHQLHAQGDFSRLTAELFQRWLPTGLNLDGQVQGDFELQWSPQQLRVQLASRTDRLDLQQQLDDHPPLAVQLRASQLQVQGEMSGAQQHWQAHALLNDASGDRLELSATSGNPLDPDAPLHLQLRPDIRHLQPYIHMLSKQPQLGAVHGQLDGELIIDGSRRQPRIDGQLKLALNAISLPELGIKLTDLAATLGGQGNALQLQAHTRSGDGELHLQGNLALADLGLSGTLTGSNFLAMNTADARVHISPDLTWKLDQNTVRVSGELRVPSASITPRSLQSSSAITASPDQVLVAADGQHPRSSQDLPLYAELRVIMGKQVHFEGAGLAADIGGAITVNKAPHAPTTASGELTLNNGSYKAYGQTLTLTRGHIVFTGGPIEEPALNVDAQRQPEPDITVGVHVRGPASNPRITLYSTPAMADAQILSWLAFGTALQEGDKNTLALQRAALALGMGQGQTTRLRDQLGLDTLGVHSSGGGLNDTALVIGKYLSTRLYVSYGIGLFDAVRTLRVRYQLTRRWTLEAESGLYRGADALFSIER